MAIFTWLFSFKIIKIFVVLNILISCYNVKTHRVFFIIKRGGGEIANLNGYTNFDFDDNKPHVKGKIVNIYFQSHYS